MNHLTSLSGVFYFSHCCRKLSVKCALEADVCSLTGLLWATGHTDCLYGLLTHQPTWMQAILIHKRLIQQFFFYICNSCEHVLFIWQQLASKTMNLRRSVHAITLSYIIQPCKSFSRLPLKLKHYQQKLNRQHSWIIIYHLNLLIINPIVPNNLFKCRDRKRADILYADFIRS